MNQTKKRMTFGIMLALSAWGLYLAVGATGMFVQEGMMDPRKSGIVAACMAMFLGLWAIVLVSTNRKLATQATKSQLRNPWSIPGLATLALALIGSGLWLAAVLTWRQVSMGTTTILGWLAALSILGSAAAGMIALSARTAQRGKWIGVLGLAGSVAALVAFVMRMSP